jgi:FkbM family methyltransferase
VLKVFKRNVVTAIKRLGFYSKFLIIREIFGYKRRVVAEETTRLADFYSEFVDESDLVFDIGANLGNRIRAFLELKARVIAIEPQQSLFPYLNFVFGKKVALEQVAVGSTSGNRTIYLSSLHTLTTLNTDFVSMKEELNPELKFMASEVKVVTMDELIEKHGCPNFCKIDVEGYELEVLKGLSKKIPKISIEFNSPKLNNQTIQCLSLLKRFGDLSCNYSFKESLVFESKTELSCEEMQEIVRANFSSSTTVYGDIYIKYK